VARRNDFNSLQLEKAKLLIIRTDAQK
jgi:hypothetical protein